MGMKSFKTKEDAITEMDKMPNQERLLLFSPHLNNKNGDYFLLFGKDAESCLVRSWEKEVAHAIKGGMIHLVKD